MRTADPIPPQFHRSTHLVELIATTERLAALVGQADMAARARLRDERLDAAAIATLRLDGSTIEEVPTPPARDDHARDDHEPVTSEGRGTWLDAFGVGEAGDDEIQAIEFAGARSALASDDLAGPLLTRPLDTLEELHRRLVRGLVDPEVTGRPRQTEQAVHDAAVGRIIFFPPDPPAVPSRLAHLETWLQSVAAREHALIVSGVLHHELLFLHPYEAANGRLARTAARLALRARGLDPDGLMAVEEVLADDVLGYYDEVARTVRRRDLTIWLERWGEAVTAGLRVAAWQLGTLDASLPDRAAAFLEQLEGDGFTVADYRADAKVGPEEARADLELLLDSGRIRQVIGSRGLRFTVTPHG